MTHTATFHVKEYGTNNEKVILLLGGWKTKQLLYALPALLLSRSGYRCIVYTYEHSVLSPDVVRTRDSLQAIRDDILQRVQRLKRQGISEFSLFGFSLGSVLGCMVANQEPAINKVVLNTVGTSLAAAVWSWDERMPGFKQSLIEQGYTHASLEEAWHDLAPANNIRHFDDKSILLYLVAQDTVIPFRQGEQFAAILRNANIPLQIVINKHGNHAIAGALNIYNVKRYLRFLESEQ